MSRVLRWLIIVPAAVAAWYLALALGLGMYGGVDALCPSNQRISGQCIAPWFNPTIDALIAIGAAVSAIFVVLTATFIAPSHKLYAAVASYIIGGVVAVAMGFESKVYAALLAALIAGALTLAIVLRKLAQAPLPNTSLERTRGR
jgi:fructose-specific phosphotransferase system IIC component